VGAERLTRCAAGKSAKRGRSVPGKEGRAVSARGVERLETLLRLRCLRRVGMLAEDLLIERPRVRRVPLDLLESRRFEQLLRATSARRDEQQG
jgi:hypothetical protein